MSPQANRTAAAKTAGLPRITGLFGRIRRGLRMRAALGALELAAVVALGFWLAAMVADALFTLGAVTRLVALTVTCAAAAGTFAWLFARGAAGRIGPVYLASRVEALYPQFAGRLIAAVELAARLPVAPLHPSRPKSASVEVNHDHAAALVREQAESLVDEVDPARVVAPAGAREAERTNAHRYLLWSMAFVLVAALVTGRDFPNLATRSLFPWLSPRTPDAAFFRVRPSAVEVEEGERFTVEASLRGPEPERVVLELAPAGDGEGSATRIRMKEGPIPRRWSAEAGPVSASGSFRLVAEYGREGAPLEGKWLPVRLLPRPRARSMSVRYVYPEYTGRAGRREPGGVIDAPVGTTATVEIVPQRPFSSATAVVEGGRRIAMRRVQLHDGRGEAWCFTLGVARSGSYRIEMESTGVLSRSKGVRARTESFPVVARPDRPPRCEASFVRPPGEGPSDVFSRGASFRVRASDDFGLRELVLVVRRLLPSRGGRADGGGDIRKGMNVPKSIKRGKGDVHYIPVPGFEPGARAFSRELRVPPQVLPVEPGVTYTYYVRAVDGYPPSPQLATSPERTFRLSRSAAPKAMLARARRKKRRPPLLEPEDDQPEEPLGPQADGARGRRPSRSLAGLSDGERRQGSGGRPPKAVPGEQERPKSPYASAPGPLQPGKRGGGQEKDKGKDKGKGKGKDSGTGSPEGGEKSPRETASAGGGQGDRSGGNSSGRSGEKKRREKPQLPGQGGLPDAGKAPERQRTAAGGSSGSRPGSGRRSGSRRQAPDATGSGPEGGGRPDAGLADKRRRDGGIPTGAETGVGAASPETVDKEAVDALSVRRDELGDTLKDVRVPGRTPGLGKDAPGGGELSTDLGRGRRRRIGPFVRRNDGGDRIAISKDDLPTPAVVRSTPVGRMYRALVDEYFRRLEELAGER